MKYHLNTSGHGVSIVEAGARLKCKFSDRKLYNEIFVKIKLDSP